MMNNLPLIRYQQLKYTISPFYNEAGLVIGNPTTKFVSFTKDGEITSERYIVSRIKDMKAIAYLKIDEIPFIGDLYSLNIIAGKRIGLVHSISVRHEIAKGFSKKNKHTFRRVYIHRDDRVEALKQALVHIVLMGDYQ